MLFKHALVPNAAHERHELALISCGDAGSTVVFTKSHDFVGPYEIGIVVANRIPMPLPAKRPEPAFGIKARYEGSDDCLREVHGNQSPWWADDKSGFTLFLYSAPENVPLKVPVQFELSVVQASQDFEATYGPSFVYCSKYSDK